MTVQAKEARGDTLQEVPPIISDQVGKKPRETGDVDAGILSLDMAIGRIDKILTAKEVIDWIVSGARRILGLLKHE